VEADFLCVGIGTVGGESFGIWHCLLKDDGQLYLSADSSVDSTNVQEVKIFKIDVLCRSWCERLFGSLGEGKEERKKGCRVIR
jgi:hypothetical protein